jgi:hypothetical protein
MPGKCGILAFVARCLCGRGDPGVTVIRYYARLFLEIPRLTFGAFDWVLTAAAALTFAAFLLNPELADRITEEWRGVSRLWALVPLGALLLYGLLKANHQHVSRAAALDDPLAQERREHDRAAVRRIRETLPRPVVDFLRDHDFGGMWEAEWMFPVNALTHQDAPEHAFHDANLERLRRDFMEAVNALALRWAYDTSPNVNRADWQDLGVSAGYYEDDPESDRGRLWHERRARVNEASTRVVVAYDALMAAAKDAALLD